MSYTINDARHRFSAWAAARAAQAGSAKAKRAQLISAIEHCGVRKFLMDPHNHLIMAPEFDTKHDEWVENIRRFVKRRYKRGLSYGVAAKVLSTYLKSVFVLAGFEETPLAQAIHPPVDSILLKALDAKFTKSFSKQLKWQRLTVPQYRTLIAELRSLNGPRAFWNLEEHWAP